MATEVANPGEVRVGQTGTVFRLQITDDATGNPVDVSNANTIEVRFKAPDGTTLEKTAQFSTDSDHAGDGTDGWIEWKDDQGEAADQAGDWYYWGYAELPGGFTGDSTPLYYKAKEPGSE